MIDFVTRLFSLPDEDVMLRAGIFNLNLKDDLLLFSARFPFVNMAYRNGFMSVINVAKAIPSDGEVVLDIKVLTQNVNVQLGLGKTALQDLGVYARLAYKNDPARQRAFGQDDWQDAFGDHEKMALALRLVHNQLTDPNETYGADLAAKGYLPAQVSYLDTLAKAVETSNLIQEQTINERPVTTQTRILALNTVWSWMDEISTMTEVVFRTDVAKRRQYLLYPPSSGAAPAPKVTITVYKKDTTDPLPNALVTLVNMAGLDAAATNGEGKVEFQSPSFPDLLEVKIEHEALGGAVYDGLAVMVGEDAGFVLEMPKG